MMITVCQAPSWPSAYIPWIIEEAAATAATAPARTRILSHLEYYVTGYNWPQNINGSRKKTVVIVTLSEYGNASIYVLGLFIVLTRSVCDSKCVVCKHVTVISKVATALRISLNEVSLWPTRTAVWSEMKYDSGYPSEDSISKSASPEREWGSFLAG